MKCSIEGDEIVVRLPIANLPVIWDACPLNAYSDDLDDPCSMIEDAGVFAPELVLALTHESEDGTTVLHTALDAAMRYAVDQGAAGVV